MTYPDDEQVSYAYDARMQLASLTGTSTYLESNSYDSAGRLTAQELGNGLTRIYTHRP